MTDLSKHLLEECKTNMQGAVNFLESAMHKIRAGKASPSMLEGIKVDYYGNPTPIEQVANISTPDPKQLVIQPWEKSMLSPIDIAILAANLGFTPKFVVVVSTNGVMATLSGVEVQLAGMATTGSPVRYDASNVVLECVTNGFNTRNYYTQALNRDGYTYNYIAFK